MRNNLKKLGKHIRELRECKGITQEKLAFENGISKGNLSKIEMGLVDPQFTTLLKIAEGLGVDIKALFEF